MRDVKSVRCQVCGELKRPELGIPASMVRPGVTELIRAEHPWSADDFICFEDLNKYRGRYIERLLEKERGELTELEGQVVQSLREQDFVAEDINAAFDTGLTFGERLADRVADFGGSWRFIISFAAVLVGWVALNTVVLLHRPFDPYPFILLNLVLSCLAALQAPIIMMSQNRQEAKDRLRSENDFRINLKAELEIRHLNGKVDMLMTQMRQGLMEVQSIQMELMQELGRNGDHGGGRC